jgi:4-amino-4-deoxy-L-arabinose transferase-like glycosyltransferase
MPAGPISRTRALNAWLVAVFAVGLGLRIVGLFWTSELGTRVADEVHYFQLASSLVEGRGFAFPGGPTSLRPPAYPAFVAAVWSLTGTAHSLVAVRVAQMLAAALTAWLAWRISAQLYDERAGAVAAAVTWCYPSLMFANFMLLTETLFTLLLVLAVWIALRLLTTGTPGWAAALGATVAAAALTRSIMWPFPLVLAVVLPLAVPGPWHRRATVSAVVLGSAALVLAPWAVRNTRLQGVPVIVDTMGGMNLRMGNYEYTPHDRMWDAVSMSGDKSWIIGLPAHPPGGGPWNEGQKDRWARDRAVAFMGEHPGLTLWRSVIRLGDFWALERDYLAALERGMYAPPPLVGIAIGTAMLVAFPALIALAIAGIVLNPPRDWRAHAFLLLLIAFICGLHALVFAHPRYRLPLTPLFAIYAAAGWVWWASKRHLAPTRQIAAAAAIAGALAATWTVQFVWRDWPHAERLIAHIVGRTS